MKGVKDFKDFSLNLENFNWKFEFYKKFERNFLLVNFEMGGGWNDENENEWMGCENLRKSQWGSFWDELLYFAVKFVKFWCKISKLK